MRSDAELDSFLRRQLEEPPLPDEGFRGAVVAGIARHRRRRRWALAAATVAATVVTAVGVYLSPAPLLPLLAITPAGVAATLLLVAACSLVWIGTASRPTTPSRA